MKLQKAMVVLGLSACLIGSQVLSVIAQEQPALQQEMEGQQETEASAGVSEVQAPSEEPQTVSSEPNVPAAEAQTPAVQPEQPASDTQTQPEQPASDTQTQPEQPATDTQTRPEDGGQATEQESKDPAVEDGKEQDTEEAETDPDLEEDPAEDVEQEGDFEPEEDEKEDAAAEEKEAAEDPVIEEEPAKDEASAVQPAEPAGDQAAVSAGSGAASIPAAFTSAASVSNSSRKHTSGRTSDSFRASEKFLDTREKIKYNVDLPLEGIPSFITQEMIIGALKCQDETGYPASVTIAQIIQESGYGKYGPGGEDGEGLSYLAFQYNNLFGIKGTGPAGSVDMRTGEQTSDGTGYMTTAGFRVYNTYTECIEDRAELLEEVYKDLTFGVEDANTFAMKIGSRWATDVDYGQTLIRVMERYDLYRLDEMTLGTFSDMLGTFVHPCPGAVLTSTFGYREAPTAGASTMHKGIDLGTGAYNIPTYAAAEGTVTFAGEAGSAGLMVVIDHGNGLVTKYMHHDRIYVEEGDTVEKGQQIGLSGTTGVSTGNHLHFQVEENGQAADPLTYINIEEK